MPTPKSRILTLQRYLQTQTDEAHPATMPDILAYLQSEGISASRKTVTQDIAQIMEAGVDVVCNPGHRYEYFVGERHFELPELKLLVDAVQASHFITARKSETLIGKLMSFASRHQAGELNRQLYVDKHVKPENEHTYITVDLLHAAINAGRQITFKYYDLDIRKKKSYKHDRYLYTFSPYALLWNNDKYYTVGFSEKHGKAVTFRVDRIAAPRLSHHAAAPKPKGFDINLYTKSTFQMYDGSAPQTVTLQCKDCLMNSVVDRFGKRVKTSIIDNRYFIAEVNVSASPTFYGWVFSFGGRMQILAPESVVLEYKNLARSVIGTK